MIIIVALPVGVMKFGIKDIEPPGVLLVARVLQLPIMVGKFNEGGMSMGCCGTFKLTGAGEVMVTVAGLHIRFVTVVNGGTGYGIAAGRA